MNIFILDTDPVVAAQYHNDSHVRKMILESVQMLCHAHWELDSVLCHNPLVEYQGDRHRNHPCTKWVLESATNYRWLHALGVALCDEFYFRFAVPHADVANLNVLESVPSKLDDVGLTPFVKMTGTVQNLTSPVDAYRLAYMTDKRHLAGWTRRGEPSWWAPDDVVNASLPV